MKIVYFLAYILVPFQIIISFQSCEFIVSIKFVKYVTILRIFGRFFLETGAIQGISHLNRQNTPQIGKICHIFLAKLDTNMISGCAHKSTSLPHRIIIAKKPTRILGATRKIQVNFGPCKICFVEVR